MANNPSNGPAFREGDCVRVIGTTTCLVVEYVPAARRLNDSMCICRRQSESPDRATTRLMYPASQLELVR